MKMSRGHNFIPEYEKFITLQTVAYTDTDAVTNCEQDSGFKDSTIQVTDNNEEKSNTTRSNIESSKTDELHRPGQKRNAGRPLKRYDTQFRCDLCDYTTAFAKLFRIHLTDVHQEEQARIFKCTHCSEAYVEERFLHEHIKHIHECIPKKPKMICDVCGKGFPKQCHLKRHSYVHNPNEKPFLCEECPKRFPSQSSLDRHFKGVHSTEKPYECMVCGATFGHIYGLKAHKLNVH